MVIADILNITNLGSVNTDTTGSAVNISRISRTSVFVQVSALTSGTVAIQASATGSNWFDLDSKSYSSGTSLQTDIFSYNSNFPLIRTNLTGASGTFSTIITGRGV